LHDIAQSKIEAQKARQSAADAIGRVRTELQSVEDAAAAARKSLPIIAVGRDTAISRQGWIVHDGRPVRQITRGPAAFAKYGPDGNAFVVAESNSIYMGDADISDDRRFSAGAPIVSAAFLPDGHRIIIVDDNGVVSILESFTGVRLAAYDTGTKGISHADVSEDGHLLVTAGVGSEITLWRFPGRVLLKSVQTNNAITSLALSTNSIKVIVGFRNGTVYLINLVTGVTEDVFYAPA
jgi:WD40 repeat protein